METKPKKILIVEDDRFISEMYARTLRKNGFEVTECVTGPDGLAKAKEGGWSYILLDIMLPDKTGVEVLQELRGDGKPHNSTKIIIITNFEQDDATRQAMEKLADGYLIKAEITPRRMLEIVQEMEQQQANAALEDSTDTAEPTWQPEAATPAPEPDPSPAVAAPEETSADELAPPKPEAQPTSPEQDGGEEPETPDPTPAT